MSLSTGFIICVISEPVSMDFLLILDLMFLRLCTPSNVQGLAEVLPTSVAGGARECLARDGQQFEHFTYNVIHCA